MSILFGWPGLALHGVADLNAQESRGESAGLGGMPQDSSLKFHDRTSTPERILHSDESRALYRLGASAGRVGFHGPLADRHQAPWVLQRSPSGGGREAHQFAASGEASTPEVANRRRVVAQPTPCPRSSTPVSTRHALLECSSSTQPDAADPGECQASCESEGGETSTNPSDQTAILFSISGPMKILCTRRGCPGAWGRTLAVDRGLSRPMSPTVGYPSNHGTP